MLRRNIIQKQIIQVTRLCIFYPLGPYQITDLNLQRFNYLKLQKTRRKVNFNSIFRERCLIFKKECFSPAKQTLGNIPYNERCISSSKYRTLVL